MKVKILSSKTSGSVRIPSSKSDAHRALICASLASNKTSIISNIDYNDDINATLNALQSFGAKVIKKDHEIEITGASLTNKGKLSFNANESGSTLRFLIPLFAHFSDISEVYGTKRLLERPISVYQEVMKDGLSINDSRLILNYKFKAGNYQIKGNVSSQFITGLLFLLPLLDGDSQIEILPPFESSSYVKMTINLLNKFGIKVDFNDKIIKVKGNQEYKAYNHKVEGDYSQTAFFASLGVLNGDISCIELDKFSLQGDKVIIDFLSQMGGKVSYSDNNIRFTKSNLKAITIDLANCPDLGPVLMCVASLSNGVTHFTNVARLRLKESDRVGCMEEELAKFGVKITSSKNDVYIEGSNKLYAPKGEVNSHNDHRIAMSLSILMTSLNEGEMILCGAECINKSYPNFYKDLESVGGKVVYLHD